MAHIYLAGDHAGFELKEALAPFLRELGHEVEDVGPATYDEGDDYPEYMLLMAARVASTPGSFGVGLGGSGQGEAMAANRVKGARAAVYYGGSDEVLKKSREHNNANILSIGARFVSPEEAKKAVMLWLATPFSREERHVRRISKLGFTMVEAMIAVTIVAILGAIVIAGVTNSKQATRDAQKISDLRSLQLALGLYKDDYGAYPSTGGAWKSGTTACHATYGSGNSYTGSTGYIPGLAPTYIGVLPEVPNLGTNKCFLYRSDGSDYKLLVWNAIETYNANHELADPGYSGTAPNCTNARNNTYAVYTQGAYCF